MILTLGCPVPHPSSSAAAPFSIPRVTALLLELALTTAWARLRRPDGGCSGIVYRNNSTAKARTSGARFVCKAVREIRPSSMFTGNASDASNSAGDISSKLIPGSKSFCPEPYLVRLDELPPSSVAVRLVPALASRLRNALQAEISVLACFSSFIADVTVASSASAICLTLWSWSAFSYPCSCGTRLFQTYLRRFTPWRALT